VFAYFLTTYVYALTTSLAIATTIVVDPTTSRSLDIPRGTKGATFEKER